MAGSKTKERHGSQLHRAHNTVFLQALQRTRGCASRTSNCVNRFVADGDAARGQKVFEHSQAERKAEIEPDRVGDHSVGKRWPR